MDERPERDSLGSRVADRVKGLYEGHTTRTLVVVGVVALLLAGVLGYVTVRDTVADPAVSSSDTATSADPTPSPVSTRDVVHRRGGFRLAVPEGMKVTRERRTIRLTGEDKTLVVTVGPGEAGPLGAAHRRILRTVRTSYRKVEILANQPLRVDDRPARTSSGLATNSQRVRLRFVVVTVRAKPRNYTIAAYAARDSAPADVLPLVNAVANGFEVLPRKRG